MKRKIQRTILYAILGITIVGFINVLLAFYLKERGFTESVGEFGDIFGLTTSIASSAAFIGLMVTIFYQSNELSLQREELTLTREELAGQKNELERQNQISLRQMSDARYMDMLRLFIQMKDRLKKTYQDRSSRATFGVHKTVNGDDVISYMFTTYVLDSVREYKSEKDDEVLRKALRKAEKESAYVLGSYNRILDTLLRDGLELHSPESALAVLEGTMSEIELAWHFHLSLIDDRYQKAIRKGFMICLLEGRVVKEEVKVLFRRMHLDNRSA